MSSLRRVVLPPPFGPIIPYKLPFGYLESYIVEYEVPLGIAKETWLKEMVAGIYASSEF